MHTSSTQFDTPTIVQTKEQHAQSPPLSQTPLSTLQALQGSSTALTFLQTVRLSDSDGHGPATRGGQSRKHGGKKQREVP